jgi:hypothetical protein
MIVDFGDRERWAQIWAVEIIDPSDKEDLKELSYFIKHTTWKTTCPFLLEYPHKDIVSMCQVFYTEHMLRKLAK